MHEMQAIVTDDPGVCLFVCHVAQLDFTAKLAEQIKMLFGVNTLGDPWNILLDGDPDPPQRGEGASMHPPSDYFGLLFRYY